MSLTILKGDSDAPISGLAGRTIAVLGYGNQGQAHAMNLRDSGLSVVIGSRPGRPGSAKALADGFETLSIEDAAARADLAIVALPDEAQPECLEQSIIPAMKPGTTIGFLHGFAVTMTRIAIPETLGIVMVAPKGPGTTLRQRFVAQQGIPALVAVHQETPDENARDRALAWANGIGCARAGLIMTSMDDECRTDLFGEQAVLCGGMTWLILAAFETLVEAGYPPELAYLECCHEAKQVADLVYERGLAGMMEAISNTAEYGAHRAGPRIATEALRTSIRTMLGEIEDGTFARTMMVDYKAGFEAFNSARAALREHPIEAAGRTVRSLMPWLPEGEPPSDGKVGI